MKRIQLTVLTLVCVIAFFPHAADFKLGMDDTTDVKAVGKQLMAFDFGLHRLEHQDATSEVRETVRDIVIGVHGWRSEGYEWVYPLNQLSGSTTDTFFYRWDFTECPVDGGRMLIVAVKNTLEQQEGSVESITLVGHSLGGVLVASIASEWALEVPTEMHVVAAPLAWMDQSECEQSVPEQLTKSVSFYQWRTQQALDNTFKSAPSDPQDADIVDSIVVTLPDTYRTHRLGHNWSVSYVADRLRKARDSEAGHDVLESTNTQ